VRLREQNVELRVQTDVFHPDDVGAVLVGLLPHHRQPVHPHQALVVAAVAASGDFDGDVAHHVDVDVLFDGAFTRFRRNLSHQKL
jgi:hypothetical protein